MKRRLLRILGIGTAVLVFTGYFAFSTFVFSPFESDYEFELSTLVPRDVEVYLGKARLGEEFASFPTLRFAERLAATERGQRLLDSSEWAGIEAELGLDRARQELQAGLDRLPIPVDPLDVAGGRELALATYATASTLEASDWAAYLRTNWVGKLAVAMLDHPDLLGLSSQGLTVERFESSVRLSGAGLPRPLFVSRLRDVLIVSSAERLVTAAHELDARKGEDSLGQSASYFDNVTRIARDGDELRLAIDYHDAATRFGWPLDEPSLSSPDPNLRFLAQLFQPRVVREITGLVGFRRGISLELVGELDSDRLSSLQKRTYRKRDADQRRMSDEVARFAPSDCGLFAYLEADLADLLSAWLASAEPALRSNLESEIVRPVFGKPTVDEWVTELGSIFAERVAVILRPNDFPVREGDPPNDGRPTFAWAIVLWTEDSGAAVSLRDKVIANQPRLGIRGPSAGERGVFRLEVEGGNTVFEYWAPLVPGTGHIATLQDQDFLIVSNHSRMLEMVIDAYYKPDERKSLADRPEFQGLAAAGLPAATLALWLNPEGLTDTLVELAEDQARFDALNGIDWTVKRAEIEQRVLRENFPGEVWNSVSVGVQAEYERLVEEEIVRFREARQAELVPELVGRAERRADALELISSGLVQLRFEPKEMAVAARLLLPLDD